MKILLGEGFTVFSGKALLFEPASSATHMEYNMMTKHISYVTTTNEHRFLITDHVGGQDTQGILHAECLKALYATHPEHFAKVYSMAEDGKLNPYNTFLYESPDEHAAFPSKAQELIQKLATGELLASRYEQLYDIGSYAQYIERYFERITTRDTIVHLVEFCNTLKNTTELKTFLASLLAKLYVKWQIPDENQ